MIRGIGPDDVFLRAPVRRKDGRLTHPEYKNSRRLFKSNFL